MMKNYFSFFVILLVQLVSAQNKSFEPTLWLHQDLNTNSNITKINYFNFNPVFFSANTQDYTYTNLSSNSYTLFAAFKSDLTEELELIDFKDKKGQVLISNKQLSNGNNVVYQKVDAKEGLVLSYLHNQTGRRPKKGKLNLINLSRVHTEEGTRSDLFELLFFPRIVDALERQKIESYLSIKYGISLVGEVDYLNFDGDKVWDVKKHKSYNYRVTGIGKDSFLNLNQKQSGNAQKDGLYIGLESIHKSNQENPAKMSDKFFFLWGDNNGSLTYVANKKESGDLKKMNRIWSTQITNRNQNEELLTQLILDKSAFSIGEKIDVSKPAGNEKEDFIWLAIDRNSSALFDYQNADYYMQSRDEAGQLFFDNVAWDTDKSGSDSFTFVMGPDFFVNYKVSQSDCTKDEFGTVVATIVGGQPPYKIDVKTSLNATSYTTEKKSYILSNLDANLYSIAASDGMRRMQNDTLSIKGIKNVTINLAPEWTLGASKEVVIIPTIENSEQQKLTFIWKQGDRIVTHAEQFTATEPGNYSLRTTNEIGCSDEVFFKVVEMGQYAAARWVLYPNPGQMDVPFALTFNLEKEANVSIAIFDFSNKLIKSAELGSLKEHTHFETLSSVGTFLVVVTIDGEAESTKIIIR